jgi:hypothetical protein
MHFLFWKEQQHSQKKNFTTNQIWTWGICRISSRVNCMSGSRDNGHEPMWLNLQGWLSELQDFFGGQHPEFHTYNLHRNCFYVYLMSISTLFFVGNPYPDHLHLQTDIRAKRVTYAILGFWVPTNTINAIAPWFRGIAQQPRDHSEAHC